jgi:hypothetical protein
MPGCSLASIFPSGAWMFHWKWDLAVILFSCPSCREMGKMLGCNGQSRNARKGGASTPLREYGVVQDEWGKGGALEGTNNAP